MQEKELFDEYFLQSFKQEIDKKRKQRIFLVFLSLLFGVYAFFLIFGNNSFVVLKQLKKEKIKLDNETMKIQRENVELQKIIFELKGLEPNGVEE